MLFSGSECSASAESKLASSGASAGKALRAEPEAASLDSRPNTKAIFPAKTADPDNTATAQGSFTVDIVGVQFYKQAASQPRDKGTEML